MADQHTTYADQAERYRLDTRIATGGMGHVWRGTDTVLDRPVAVKVLKHEYADDAVFRSRFETEARHAAGLRHPGVAQVFDFGGTPEDQAPYLVMEYVAGPPLSEALRAGEPMDPDAAAEILAAAADALGAAHAQGIVHRDVKPANLMLTADHRVKVTDFGIARAADGLALTRTGEVMGTPQYLSPEQASGDTATPASDVYSLGVVGFECLTGRRPFAAETPVATALAHLREPVPELPPEVPAALAAVIRRALAKDPAQRYPDATVFAAAVREAAGIGVDAPPAPTRAFTAPVPRPVLEPVAPAEEADRMAAWRERAGRVPVPVWAVAGVFVVIVLVAALTNLGGGGATPAGTPASHRTPAAGGGSSTTRSVTTGTTPSTTTSTSTSTTASKPAPVKPPKRHGPKPGHGHHGKGHQ